MLEKYFPNDAPTVDGPAEYDTLLEVRRRWLDHRARIEILNGYIWTAWKLGATIALVDYLTGAIKL